MHVRPCRVMARTVMICHACLWTDQPSCWNGSTVRGAPLDTEQIGLLVHSLPRCAILGLLIFSLGWLECFVIQYNRCYYRYDFKVRSNFFLCVFFFFSLLFVPPYMGLPRKLWWMQGLLVLSYYCTLLFIFRWKGRHWGYSRSCCCWWCLLRRSTLWLRSSSTIINTVLPRASYKKKKRGEHLSRILVFIVECGSVVIDWLIDRSIDRWLVGK